MTSWFKVSVTSLRSEALQTQYKAQCSLLHHMQQHACWARELYAPSLPTQPLRAALQKPIPDSQFSSLPQNYSGRIHTDRLRHRHSLPYSFFILILIWMERSFTSKLYPSCNIHTKYLYNSSNEWTCVHIWEFFCYRHLTTYCPQIILQSTP